MSKITKNDLKGIVKECLIEILAEGLATGRAPTTLSERKEVREKLVENSSADRYAYLDNIKVGKKQSRNTSSPEILKTAKTISKDPVMNSIFADTARTTLQEQGLANNAKGASGKPLDHAARIVESSDPSELFAGAAQNWAHLAFSDNLSKS